LLYQQSKYTISKEFQQLFMNWSAWKLFIDTQPAFRQRQINHAVFKELAANWSAVSVLPLKDRQWLETNCPLDINYTLSGKETDPAQKARIVLADGLTIETVIMHYGTGRQIVCLSSQVGCPLGCAFCQTGQQGFKRNLTAGEIVEQALLWQRLLAPAGQHINNLVFMGMGEPLLNLPQVLEGVEWLHSPSALDIGWRHIAISTVGLMPELKHLLNYGQQIKIAWSLHAPEDKWRDQLMPINRRYSLAVLKPIFREYVIKTNRRLMIEYLLLDHINDQLEQAEELANFLADFPKNLLLINLLNYNPGVGNFHPSSSRTREAFIKFLEKRGYKVTTRLSLGQDILGACGQLGI